MENKMNVGTSKEKGLGSELKNEIQTAGKDIGILASNVADRTKGYVTTSRDYVKENPVAGIAIATVAGMAAGSLFTLAAMRVKKIPKNN